MLNVFTGLNGMGKSTFLQAILLLKQTFERRLFLNGLLLEGIMLNGPLLSLGRGKDVLCDYAQDDIISFELIWDDGEKIFIEGRSNAESDFLDCPSTEYTNESLARLNKDTLHYIPSDRITPKATYPASTSSIIDNDSLGQHGEYTAHYIAEHALNMLSIPELKHRKASSHALSMNIDA